MGQTLTHGIYLPDEGERNCYDGLASNWQLLDGAVGTVAEHTSQIAGKAPAVHTHTKADITDFPAYGNTAGTICEGNDSRLSDARTPVAHTHGKADITDLLNSNFIPSANNSYDLGSSSYQWKTLNGTNPGALSLPDYSQYEPINFSQWNTSGALTNTYTPTEDGLLYVNIKDTATNSIYIYARSISDAQTYSVSAYGNGSQGYSGRLSTIIPVIKGITYAVVIKASSVNDIYAVTFFPALGNV